MCPSHLALIVNLATSDELSSTSAFCNPDRHLRRPCLSSCQSPRPRRQQRIQALSPERRIGRCRFGKFRLLTFARSPSFLRPFYIHCCDRVGTWFERRRSESEVDCVRTLTSARPGCSLSGVEVCGHFSHASLRPGTSLPGLFTFQTLGKTAGSGTDPPHTALVIAETPDIVPRWYIPCAEYGINLEKSIPECFVPPHFSHPRTTASDSPFPPETLPFPFATKTTPSPFHRQEHSLLYPAASSSNKVQTAEPFPNGVSSFVFNPRQFPAPEARGDSFDQIRDLRLFMVAEPSGNR